MKRMVEMALAVVFALLVMAPAWDSEADAAKMTITGEVNDNYQIVAGNGTVYDVADTEAGNRLVTEHIGEVVRVTGNVIDEEGAPVLVVEDFQVTGDGPVDSESEEPEQDESDREESGQEKTTD